jgi:DNA-binding transcriptional ArsR family regulator
MMLSCSGEGPRPIACESIDQLMKLLQDRTRRKVFSCLALGERNVTSLAAATRLAIAQISQALKAFKICGLVERRRDKHQVFYRLSRNVVVPYDAVFMHVDLQAANGEHMTLDLRYEAPAGPSPKNDDDM